MTPKVLHYCWFGGKPKPPSVQRYIENWRDVLPGYEICEWNELNFNLEAWPYAMQALEAGKYAFVSDVARLHALFERGGVYLDTDVELLRPLDELLNVGVVLGFEEFGYIATSTMIAPRGAKLIGDFLERYRSCSFTRPDRTYDQTTNVEVLTTMLEQAGLKRDGQPQEVNWWGERVTVLDQLKFSPMDYANGINKADETTFAVHHFGQSWNSPVGRLHAAIRKLLIRLIGGSNLKKARAVVRALVRRL